MTYLKNLDFLTKTLDMMKYQYTLDHNEDEQYTLLLSEFYFDEKVYQFNIFITDSGIAFSSRFSETVPVDDLKIYKLINSVSSEYNQFGSFNVFDDGNIIYHYGLPLDLQCYNMGFLKNTIITIMEEIRRSLNKLSDELKKYDY